MRKQLDALFFLATHLCGLLLEKLGRLLTRPTQGKRQFLKQYEENGLWALTPEVRAALFESSACIHCGLCEAILPKNKNATSHSLNPSTPALFLGALRHLPSFSEAKNLFDRYRDDLSQLEMLCPQKLPAQEIANKLGHFKTSEPSITDRAQDQVGD
ncbi:hypothetical protein D6783_03355 [Candidatus Woesearchaeota archaeon]|nr:MAG: hypothetical protein D6783_03355 [Candidatus Woesearchaeota archaeon]